MPQLVINWTSTVQLQCTACLPADVILCVNPEKTVDSLTAIPAVVTARTFSKNPCGLSNYTYTFEYNSDLLLEGEVILRNDITGVFCKGCLTEWVEEQIQNGAGAVNVDVALEGDGLLATPISVRVSADVQNDLIVDGTNALFVRLRAPVSGNILQYNVGPSGLVLTCEDIRDCIFVDPYTIEGDGSEEYPFSALGGVLDCEEVLACIHVDPYTISGDGSESYPFSVIGGGVLDCEEVLACINVDPYTIEGDGSPEYPFEVIAAPVSCTELAPALRCYDPKLGAAFYDDFLVEPPFGVGSGVSSFVSGEDTAIFNSILPFSNSIGELTYLTGSTSDGIAVVSSSPAAPIAAGGDTNAVFETSIILQDLSGGGDEYIVVAGFQALTYSGGVQDGNFFLYDAQGNTAFGPSGNWLAVNIDGGSDSSIDTGVAVATFTRYTLRVERDDTTETRFYINGVLVGTSNTDVGSFVHPIAVILEKFVGTNSRLLLNDYMMCNVERLTPLS